MNTTTEKQKKFSVESIVDDPELGWKTTLFNDNIHTFDEVIDQLMKAIACSYEEGRRYANIVHTYGKATVYKGTQKKCEAVAKVLGDIHLRTVVTQ